MRQVKIFVSYARTSPRDIKFVQALEKQLAALRRNGLDIWYEGKFPAGSDKERESRFHLRKADIILLITSPDYIADEYCYDHEVAWALEMDRAGVATVVQILFRPNDRETTVFGWCPILPANERYFSRWTDKAEAMQNIVDGLKEIIWEVEQNRPLRETNRKELDPRIGVVPIAPAIPPLHVFEVKEPMPNRAPVTKEQTKSNLREKPTRLFLNNEQRGTFPRRITSSWLDTLTTPSWRKPRCGNV